MVVYIILIVIVKLYSGQVNGVGDWKYMVISDP